jgi:predicted nucleic acid-binding protein
MKFLLDTNVLSEGSKKTFDVNVARWMVAHSNQSYMSVISIAEIRNGIERLAQTSRRAELEHWFTDKVIPGFAGRILVIDTAVADTCGQLMAQTERYKLRVIAMDIWVAAIASQHGMTVATRTVRDFDGLGVPTVDPWQPLE